jgi:hypothetical protein
MGELPGRWAGEARWPSPSLKPRALYLAPGVLADAPPSPSRLTYVGDKLVGLAKPEWIPYAVAELPGDQSADDAKSLVFELPALAEDLEILGVPTLRLRVTSNRPVAKLAARLSEVGADGRAWLVTSGLLNLTFRGGLNAPPKPLTPGEPYDIVLPLTVIAHRFKAGSKIRLALSESLWPLAWPSPEIVTLTLDLGEAHLTLPVRPIPAAEPDFPIPVTHSGFSRGEPELTIAAPDASGTVRIHGAWPDQPSVVSGVGTELSGAGPDMALAFNSADPSSCVWRASQSNRFRRGDWDAETRVTIEMTANETTYFVTEQLTALKDGSVWFHRERSDAIARRLT